LLAYYRKKWEDNMLGYEDILQTLKQKKEYLRKEYGVQRIGVFGSYARGTQTQDSDIDFVVEFDEDIPDLFETKYRLRQFLDDTFDRQVDLANLEAIKPYILKVISKDFKYAE